MCKAYSIDDFNMEINELGGKRLYVYKKLIEPGVERWSRAYYPNDRYNYMTSNSAESINALTRDVRKIPIANLMESYRDLVQRWYCDRRDKYKVVKPPLMDKRPSGRPKSTNRIRSQGEKPVQIRCGRCGAHGHNRQSCRETMPKNAKISERGSSQ
nr:transposase, MuDR, MULE transposase domain protein [Tanacetum cinerariifolium]